MNAALADEIEDRRLDPLLGRVHCPDVVPIAGALGEIGRRLLAPRLARDFQPGAIGLQRRIGGRDAADQFARRN